MAAADFYELVQNFYVGFYGRPADVEGLEYWAEKADSEGWTTVRDAFAESEEAQKFVFQDPETGEPYGNDDLVNNIYQNLFGRDADPEGLEFYTEKLDSGEMTLDTIVHNIIDGAQDLDATVMDNKVEVANYFTDNLGDKEYGEDEIPEAQELIAGELTDVEAAKEEADDVIDSFPDPVVPGDDFYLEVGKDDLTGTEASDTFYADAGANDDGYIGNALNTGDRLDGDGGQQNTLDATVVSDYTLGGASTPIRPITENIQDVKINASLENGMFNFEDVENNTVAVNTEAMKGVEEWTSSYSQANLTLQNLTTESVTEDVTLRMDHTGNDDGAWAESDFTALFDENHLTSGETIPDETIQYEVMNQDAYDAGQANDFDLPLTSVVFNEFRFELDGVEYDLTDTEGENLLGEANDTDGTHIQTYQDLVDQLNITFDELRDMYPDRDALNDLEANLGEDFTETDGRTGSYVNVSTSGAYSLGFPTENPNNSVFLKESEENAVVDGVEVEASNRLDRADEEPALPAQDEPITATAELEKVGRGGDGGELIVTGMNKDDGRGIDEMDITVFGDEDMPSSLSGINVTHGGVALDKITIATAAEDADDPADLEIGNGNSSESPLPSSLDTFDADDFLGDLNLGTASNPVENDGGSFDLGQGDNTAYMAVTSDLNENGSSLEVNSNAGDDSIYMDVTSQWGAAGRNIEIDAGNGDNTVALDSGTAYNDNEELIGGSAVDITTGNGDDAIFTDGHSDMNTDGNPGEWYYRADQTSQFFNGQLRVVMNSGESLNNNDAGTGLVSDWVDIDSSDYTTSNTQIYAAVEDAIESSPELDNLLDIEYADWGGITLEMQGEGDTYDLTIDVRGPAAENPGGDDDLDTDAGWYPDANTVTDSDLEEAWEAYYPDSEGIGEGSGEGPFDGTGSYNDFLTSIQGEADGSDMLNAPSSGGSGNNAITNNWVNAGAGNDVVVLSTNGEDTVEFTGNFNSTTIFNSNSADHSLNFADYLDSDAAARGSSINDELEAEDSQADGYVPYQLNENELDDQEYGSVWVDELLSANWNQDLGDVGAHNNIYTMSFDNLWDYLEEDDQVANFDLFDDEVLQSIFDDEEVTVTPDAFEGDMEDAADNKFLLFVAEDGSVEFAGDDGDGEIAGMNSIADWTDFKVFEGSLSLEDEDANEYSVDVTNEAGTVSLTDGIGEAPDVFFDITVADFPTEIAQGESITADVSFQNTGESEGTQTVEVGVVGDTYSETFEESITLGAGEEYADQFTFDMDDEGTPAELGEYEWYVETENEYMDGTFEVFDETAPTADITVDAMQVDDTEATGDVTFDNTDSVWINVFDDAEESLGDPVEVGTSGDEFTFTFDEAVLEDDTISFRAYETQDEAGTYDGDIGNTEVTVGGGTEFDQVIDVTVDDDGDTIDVDDERVEADDTVQFDFEPQVEGDDGAIVRFDNFGAEDQFKTNVDIADESYVWGTPSDDTIQFGFDWSESPDSYLVYMQGVDTGLVDDVETAIAGDDTTQEIIDLIGTHEDFSSDWLVAA